MKKINFIAIKPIDGELPRSILIEHEKTLVPLVNGIILEKQFQIEDGYLLFITENCPFEEGLHVYFVSFDGKIKDELEIGLLYASGILSNVSIEDERKISFSFFYDEKWILEVRKRPKYSFYSKYFPKVRRRTSIFKPSWFQISQSV